MPTNLAAFLLSDRRARARFLMASACFLVNFRWERTCSIIFFPEIGLGLLSSTLPLAMTALGSWTFVSATIAR